MSTDSNIKLLLVQFIIYYTFNSFVSFRPQAAFHGFRALLSITFDNDRNVAGLPVDATSYILSQYSKYRPLSYASESTNATTASLHVNIRDDLNVSPNQVIAVLDAEPSR